MTSLKEDYKAFRVLVKGHLDQEIIDNGLEMVKTTKLYKRYSSERYFEQSFSNDEERHNFVEKLAAFFGQEKEAEQRLERTLLPLYLDPSSVKRSRR